MRESLAIFQKDVGIYLKSYPAYVAAGVFLGICGYFFYWEINYFSVVCYRIASTPYLENRGFNLTEAVLSTFFMNLAVLLLLVLPMFSMRAFAEERKLGTIEVLLTYPVNDTAVILGKFLSIWFMALFMILPTISFIFLATRFGAVFDWRVVITAYIGLIVFSGALSALGLLTSVVTDSPFLSVVLSFGFLILLWMVGWGAEVLERFPADALRSLSLFEHFRNFTKGIVHTRDLFYFLFFILFFLIVAKEWLGSRRWVR